MRGIAALAGSALALLCLSVPLRAQQEEDPPLVWPDPPGVQRPAPAPAPKLPANPKGPATAPAKPGTDTNADSSTEKPAGAKAKAAKPKGAREDAKAAAAAQSVGCEGPFARDSDDARVAEAFGRDNVVFTVVDGAEGTKLNATVVFPKDPARRLEILWHDSAARARPASIVLSSGSTWNGPKGVRIGQTVAEVQRRNGRPFKLKGFGSDSGGAVSDWQHGTLDRLPGSCVLSVRFEPDPKAPDSVRGRISGVPDLLSTNAALPAAKLKVAEMFLSYP